MSRSNSKDHDDRLDKAVAEYLTAEESGTTLDPEHWLASEPDLRPELEQFLADRRRVRTAFAEASTNPPDTGFEPGAEFGGLRVVRLLRVGGMGRVYEAVQLGLDRRVAVKTIPIGNQQTANSDLFRAEVRALGLLEHQHIVPVYECGQSADRPYLVMGLMAGSLKDRLTAGPLRPREVARIVWAVALAAQYAHERGFLHRDIKPSNILLDVHGVPRLGDFGLAIQTTAGGGRAGTPGYMAPEQWSGTEVVCERSDVYGLGAVLYESLAGKPPGDPAADAWSPPVPPSAVRPRVDSRLEAICLKCLSGDPAKRYPTAAALARELDRYLRPPVRWLAIALGTLLVVAVGFGTWWAARPAEVATPDPLAAERDAEYSRLLTRMKDRALSRPMGWTWANRDDLQRAAAIETRLRDPVSLRTELARTYAHPDLREAGEFAHGVRYEVAAFRPGTAGGEVALGVHLRAKGMLTPVRVDLFDRASCRVMRSWEVPCNLTWEARSGLRDGVRGMAFTPEGRWLAVGTRGGGVFVIDVITPEAKPRRLIQEGQPVKHLFATADGAALLTLSIDGHLRRWRAGEWVQEAETKLLSKYPESWEITAGVSPITGDVWVSVPLRGGATPVSVVRFTPHLVMLDEAQFPSLLRLPAPHPFAPVVMAAAETEQGFTTEQFAAGEPSAHGFAPGLDRYELRNGFSPDGLLYFTGTDSPLVKFWDPARFTPIGHVKFAGGNGHVALAPDTNLIAITDEQSVHVYDRSVAGPERRIGFDSGGVTAIGLMPDGGGLVTVSAEGLFSWRLPDGKWLGTRSDLPYDHLSTTPRVLPAINSGGFGLNTIDGLWVVSDDRPPRRVHAATGDVHRQLDRYGRGWVWRNEKLTANGGEWQHPQPSGATRPITAVAVDGDRAVLSLSGGRAVLFELKEKLRVEREWRWAGSVWTAAALMPAGGPLLVGDTAGRLRALDPTDGRELAAVDAHTKGVTTIVPLTGGRFLSGGRDGQLHLCHLHEGRVEVEAAVAFDHPVTGIAVAVDGVTVAVLCEGERQVRVWRLDTLNDAWARLGVGLDLPPPAKAPPPSSREAPPSTAAGPGLWREVFNDDHWGRPIGTGGVSATLTADWVKTRPHPKVGKAFSIEWRGHLTPPSPGRYQFRVSADNRVSLHMSGHPLVAGVHGSPPVVGECELPATGAPVRVEYVNYHGEAWTKIQWRKPGPGGFDWRDVDASCLTPHPQR